MLATFDGYWDTWNSNHKVTFDDANKLILINPGITELNVQIDIFSDMKEWMAFNERDNMRLKPGVKSIGGQPISDVEKLGDTYFLQYGWRIKPWNGHTSITLSGNIYTTEQDRPIVPDDNEVDAVSLKVSSLTNTVIVNTSTELDTEAPIWDTIVGINNAYQSNDAINIGWGSASDLNTVRYNIYISTTAELLFTGASYLKALDGNGTAIRVEADGFNLLDTNVYYMGVTAVDSMGNETTNENYMSVSYVKSTDNEIVDANIISVNAVDVTNVNDFKADISNLSADVNVVEVAGVAIASVDDFKAVPPTVSEIVAELLNTHVHTYMNAKTVGNAIHKILYTESKIYVDIDAVVNGDGAQQDPFNIFNDAKDKAEDIKIYYMNVVGDVTIPSNFKNFNFEGVGMPLVNTNNQNLDNSKFYQCRLQGDYSGSIILQDSILMPDTTINGFFKDTVINGLINSKENTYTLLEHCVGGLQTTPTVDMNSTGSSVIRLSNYSGNITIKGSNDVNDMVAITGTGGTVTVNDDCVLGTIIIEGNMNRIGDGGGVTIIDNTSVAKTLVNQDKLDAVKITVDDSKLHTDTLVNTDISSLATSVVLDDVADELATVKLLVESIDLDMEALDENNVNSIYEKLLEVRADIQSAIDIGRYKTI